MGNQKADIMSMDLEELVLFVASIGEKKFRANQLFDWLHHKMVDTIDDMDNLSKHLRSRLYNQAYLTELKVVKQLKSKHDGTLKYLYALEDHQLIETVLMRYEHGNSVCISTQAGCRMGCTFCASGLLGLARNLTAGEMLKQVYTIEKEINVRVSHIVLMGTGEPLDNYTEILKFIRIITSEKGKNISQRHITVSTCGLVNEMYKLAEEGLQVTLAVSLHASSDAVRKQTMPIANKYTIEEILLSCENYFAKTGRRITFEYALINGVNDKPEQARALAKLLRPREFRCHVNLIPVNEVSEKSFKSSGRDAVYRFRDILKEAHIETTVRRSLGADIDAACGQLRLSTSKED